MDGTEARIFLPLEGRPELVSSGEYIYPADTVGTWRLLDFWSLHLYRYRAELTVDGQTFRVEPGYASIVKPLVEQRWHFLTSAPQVHAHYRFPAKPGAPLVALPVVQDLGKDFDRLYRGMHEALGWFQTNRLRAEIRLWDTLWELAERAAPLAPQPGSTEARWHPVLKSAVELIERRISQNLRVEALAAEVGLSQNHLIRLFQARFKTSVVGYIRRLRTERARHLLVNSTLPVKAVAVQVGLPDLQQFNKVIRRELGRSPRQVREQAEAGHG